MTPSIYDQTAKLKQVAFWGKNDAIGICAEYIRRLGNQHHVPVVDLYFFMLKINKEAQLKNKTFTIVGTDGIHPQETGHFIMAYQIINTLFPKSKIMEVRIDGTECKVTKS